MGKAEEKTARVRAVLDGREADRVPIGEWWADMEEVFHCD